MEQKRENREVAIQLSGVKKKYKLGQIGGGTLQGDLKSWWARVRGREDPNTKIGQEQRLVGQTFMALNGIDLTIYQGEALGIIGANGAGKSTMLKLLSRITAPTEGEIDIYGRIASMLEVGTGFNGEMTGRENVYMNGAILGMTKAEIDAKMEDIIEFSEVREFIDTPVKRYSSGMYVKLAFSVAAHLDSEIMIMDEVLAVGDMAFQKKCLNKMREAANKEGRTVLYVSHNMNTIRQLCDRCIVLDKGKIVFDGDVEEAIKTYLGIPDSHDYPVAYQLKENKRNYHFGKEVHFNSFRFLGKETAVFEISEPITFQVELDSKRQIDNARLVLSIKTEEVYQIGMALSKAFRIEKKDNQIFTFCPDLTALAQGKYCINFEVVEVDSTGNYYSYDNPNARIILCMENEFAHGIKWYRQYWANVSFPEFEVR